MNNLINCKIYNLWKYSFILFFLSFVINSCQDKDLEILQNFPFEVTVMPLPSKIQENETVEIRISLETASNFNETKYSIRYFQYEGSGRLQHYNDSPYLPNDEYELPQKQFRLYYTSESSESHKFSIWIKDSFGNESKVDFEFDNAS
ncbi:TraQ conjugal transfer family protein [Epilithonimonas sp.]|uniref:TraQ conjugal transfer family protein n=1 Tax=Epilithonimonas sp. TaxID=2894511 RepID=UPI00289EAD53|nr:TraQ conjugal transfer family protein [Epilithonimonas sp.]